MNDHIMQELTMREKLAIIDKHNAERDKIQQDIKFDPIRLYIYGIATGIGVVVLCLSLAKLVGYITT